MSIDPELEIWLNELSVVLFNLTPDENLENKILLAGKFFLENENITTLDDLVLCLNECFPTVNIVRDELIPIVEYLLYYSVTKAAKEKRQQCLELIMKNIDIETQSYLISVIQDLSENASSNEQSMAQDISQGRAMSEQITNNSVENNSTCNCENAKRVVALEMEIKRNDESYQNELKIIKANFLKEQDKSCSLDIAIYEKNNLIFNLEQQINDLKRENDLLKSVEEKYQSSQKEYINLKDQIEIYQSQLEKLANLEVNYDKLQSKVQEYNEIKAQLKEEMKNHSATYEKLMITENELQEYKVYKKQNELYAKDLADKQIELQEAYYKISVKEKEIDQMKFSIDSFEKNNFLNIQEKNTLYTELTETMEELRAANRTAGIGDGLCELNPVLMNELKKLSNENNELRNQLSLTSVEHLNKLRKDVQDEKLLNQSLNNKWNHTKDLLSKANLEIQNLQGCVREMQSELDDYRVRFTENTLMCEQELLCREMVNKGKRETLEVEFLQKITELTGSYTSQIRTLELDYQDQKSKSDATHQQEIVQLNEQLQSLIHDLEEEKNKRRKVERLKKLYESESQRQKLQLSLINDPSTNSSSSCSSTNVDFEIAAKEIKSMQDQLDLANKEICHLKSLIENSSSKNSQAMTSFTGHLSNPPKNSLNTRAQRMLSSVPMATPTSNQNGGSAQSSSNNMFSFLEHSEVNDKRIEQLEREKRDILSRSLEDSKEKIELSQKLLVLDKENSSLKNEIRKMVLEKERMERRLMKSNPSTDSSKENLLNVEA
jgi:hypothetical protein